jgi:hypothetical protein
MNTNKNVNQGLGAEVWASNPSNLGGRYRRIVIPAQPWKKKVNETLSQQQAGWGGLCL